MSLYQIFDKNNDGAIEQVYIKKKNNIIVCLIDFW